MSPAGKPASLFGAALPRIRDLLWRYAFALLAVTVATSIRYALGRYWGVTPTYITFYPAVMVVAVLAGLGPGLAATFLSAAAADFFFLEARVNFVIADLGDRIGIAMFIIMGASISLLAETMRRRNVEIARARSELDRAQAQSLLAAIVDSAEDAIIGKTLDGVITSWNCSAQRIFGYSAQEAIGKPIAFLLPAAGEHEESDIRSRLKGGKTFHAQDAVRRRKDGQNVHVSITISPIFDPMGNLVGASQVARDITERKQMEQELEISRAQAVSSAHLSALGMMAGNIAHEINNPLAIIHASASDLLELAEGASVPLAALRSASTRIKQTANRISKIVKSLRQIARDGGADPFQRASVGEIVEQAVELCKERFRAHSVRLDTSGIDPGHFVLCREVQIVQVLLNLLQNAFDAVADLPGDRWVRLEVTNSGSSVTFAVIDSGPGVPPELRNRIMEPFFTTKPIGKGTGLGLSLSKTIVEDHGGELKLSESANRTCFSFSLPLLKEPENAAAECLSSSSR